VWFSRGNARWCSEVAVREELAFFGVLIDD
jgi:hypothetical protein